MSLVKETIERLKQEAVWSTPLTIRGGQSVGKTDTTAILTSDETGFSISIGYHRSQHKNKETAMLLFELYLSDIFK